MIRFRAVPFGVLLILAGLAVSSARGDAVREEIALRLDQAGADDRLEAGGDVLSSRRLLPDFYQRRDFEAAWKRDGNVDALLRAIDDMQADGLDPDDYHREAILRLRTAGSRSPADRAELDLLLTDALLRVVYHAYFGKVDPERLDPNWNIVTDIGDGDPVKFIQDAIESGRVAEAIASVKPQEPYYVALKQALARYRGIAAAGGWPLLPAGPTLEPGGRDARVPVLRRRLAVTGDHAGIVPADSTLFDGPLADAVKRFQYRVMLTEDGVVGPGTQSALRIPVTQRIDEIRVDLERARWVIRHLGERHVLVNVSSAQVYLLKNRRVEWSARCQVGQTARQTPIFRADMRYLVFNPDWTVPRGILARDILPAGKRGEPILARKKLVALDRKGARVDPATIQWSRYTALQLPLHAPADARAGQCTRTGEVHVSEQAFGLPARHALARPVRSRTCAPSARDAFASSARSSWPSACWTIARNGAPRRSARPWNRAAPPTSRWPGRFRCCSCTSPSRSTDRA